MNLFTVQLLEYSFIFILFCFSLPRFLSAKQHALCIEKENVMCKGGEM